jgi:hypothetical protein
MKIKLKTGEGLSNNWKSCGCTALDWADLKAGKTIEVNSVHKLIKNKVEVLDKPKTSSASKKKEGDK